MSPGYLAAMLPPSPPASASAIELPSMVGIAPLSVGAVAPLSVGVEVPSLSDEPSSHVPIPARPGPASLDEQPWSTNKRTTSHRQNLGIGDLLPPGRSLRRSLPRSDSVIGRAHV